ncbi:MAG: hypothetical protein ACFB0E_20680 [Leptolyngbyaceae cyanobacterium]
MSDSLDPQFSSEHLSTSSNSADEISLVDILKFLKQHFKVIGGITLAATLIGIGSSFLIASQFRRELLLSIEISPALTLNLSPQLGGRLSTSITSEQIIRDEIKVASDAAIEDLLAAPTSVSGGQFGMSGSLEFVPTVDSDTLPDKARLVLDSDDPVVLESFSQSALETLQAVANEVVQSYLSTESQLLQMRLQQTQDKVDLLEMRLFSSATAANADLNELSGLLQFQQRQLVLADEYSALADFELELDRLVKLQASEEPLAMFNVLVDIQRQESTSLLTVMLLSAISGFILSILVALFVEQLPQFRAALTGPDN